MKTLYIILSFLFTAISAPAQIATTSTSFTFKSANLQAAGLTCAMCTRAINKALEKLPFVKEVEPDIQTSSFLITFKDGRLVDLDAIKVAVENAGFSVASLKVKGNFDKITVQNDAHVQIDGKIFHFLNVKEQNLEGEKTITVVDKGFVNAKEYKKYSVATTMACIKTGRAESCCEKKGIAADRRRIYHVTI